MKTKIVYEIRKYEQEVFVNKFKWINIISGYTKNSDVFKNTQYEVLETFENEQDAKEEFKDYRSVVSNEIQMSAYNNIRFVAEHELSKVKYTYDDNFDVVKSEDIKNEMANFSNYVIFKRDVEEELEYRLEIYADSFDELVEELGSLDCKICNKEDVKKRIDSLLMYDTCKFDCTYKDDYRFSIEFSYTLSYEGFVIHAD